jgi:hypothetical protein
MTHLAAQNFRKKTTGFNLHPIKTIGLLILWTLCSSLVSCNPGERPAGSTASETGIIDTLAAAAGSSDSAGISPSDTMLRRQK